MYVLVLQNTCNVGKTKSEYLISLKKRNQCKISLILVLQVYDKRKFMPVCSLRDILRGICE